MLPEVDQVKRQAFKLQEGLVESRIIIGTRTLVVKFNYLSGMTIKIILVKSQPSLQ